MSDFSVVPVNSEVREQAVSVMPGFVGTAPAWLGCVSAGPGCPPCVTGGKLRSLRSNFNYIDVNANTSS